MSRAQSHSRRATHALQKLSEADPALAALALWCAHRDADLAGDLPADSDGHTIRYAPGFAALSLPEQMGLCAHHILHIALRHSARSETLRLRLGPGFDPDLFGIAADILINETLLQAGYIQPRPHVSHATVKRELGIDSPADLLRSFDAERLFTEMRRDAAAKPEGQGKTDKIKAMAGADGFRPDIAPSPTGEDGDEDTPEARDFEWRQHLARALEAGKLAGRGIGALGFRLADIPETTTPWEVILRGLLDRATRADPRRSFRRPAGRWVAGEAEARARGRPVPVFEPALQRETTQPRIVLAIDSSGSVTGDQLAHFAAQIARIGRRVLAEIHVLIFDETVQSAHKMRGTHWAATLAGWDFARDGGTSFVDVLERAAALTPSAVVVLTDLDGPMGAAPGRAPVIWACPKPPESPPPFGRVLVLDR
ncbi:conserved hypothetical protein [Dinoroseobacter shibae DFL 12 = DSM 16493]|jgi:predicted metal-dependent peptidase|uniref:Metallopeptidase domain-containing protein n=1 Tax=Dinoroseobacter shibae (strain DSM 16493 / NCIMB 14021 / DFL 12) TaxID=398580 RepID=A8LP31_DINSH|nr:VWA-like domain-containing protein [Dinoroseobacter shibae]ABV93713.1 conserved hypothetical protein [Dinoroseobacter shibae DFL 12 = DSM 16493]URF45167.1 VWA-like domain-containing protein [Dinoroseobacter shibae]URF49472.1 VWA-like domain-containing protein [Dinoroseobacter shibae]